MDPQTQRDDERAHEDDEYARQVALERLERRREQMSPEEEQSFLEGERRDQLNDLPAP